MSLIRKMMLDTFAGPEKISAAQREKRSEIVAQALKSMLETGEEPGSG
jgi:hypothetical protein